MTPSCRALLACTALLAATPPLLAAQGDGATDPRVRAIIDSARRDSVPARALEDKALEGAAKHVPADRIVAAVRQLAGELRDARGLLRAASPGATLTEGEIVAAADATHRGVPPAELAALRRHASPQAPLVVAFTVLGDLVQRGVPADQARDAVQQLLDAGVSPQQMADIPARMDVGLRVGAPPLEALRSALPLPLRPVRPQPGATPRPL